MDLSPHERGIQIGLRVTRHSQGVPITYTRGATVLNIRRAVQGYTSKRSIEVGGEEQVVEFQQWLIAVEDLGSLGNPQAGDLIKRRIGTTLYTFTCECMEQGTPMWDWSDVAKTQFMINTRKDGASAFEVTEPSGFDLSGNELRP